MPTTSHRLVTGGRRVLSRNVTHQYQWQSATACFCGTASQTGTFSQRHPRTRLIGESGWMQILKEQRRCLSSTNLLRRVSKEQENSPEPKTKSEGQKAHIAYIAIGSNIGNRLKWIEKALRKMRLPDSGMKVTRTSSLWETEPMYVTDQDRFLNGVIEIETTLSPVKLLHSLQNIEKNLGRRKVQEKGPRNIDLDILLYEKVEVNLPDLIVPHLLMLEREFVLRPLAELIPDQELSPGKSTRDYLEALPRSESPMYSLFHLATDDHYSAIRPLNPKKRTHIMGIINLTPDSFSDGGKNLPSLTNAIDIKPDTRSTTQELSSVAEIANIPGENTAKEFVNALGGEDNTALIIDVGGQSTAPHAPEVSVEEEISRVRRTTKYVHENHPNVIISIDTYRASVAEAAIAAGAHVVNDVSAGQLDPDMLSTVARLGKTIVLMHMRGTPQTMTKLTSYPDGLIPTIASELISRIKAAEEAGIPRWRIILDPGIGFAKTTEQNLEILRRFEELRNWEGLKGFPWLVGSSRKRFIGKITKVENASERTWGSAVAVAAAIQGGADIVRVHDVREMVQVGRMADAIWRA